MTLTHAVVRESLAHHLHVEVGTIHPWDRLDADLDITPLELVLVALDIEDILGVEIPCEELCTVETVYELFAFFARALARASRSEPPAAPLQDAVERAAE